MNLTSVSYRISPIIFNGRIIDSHTHIGNHDGGIYTKQDLDVFVKSKLPNDDIVDKMIVSDLDVLHGTKSEYEGNKAALKTFENDNKYVLLASCNPKNGDVKNIEKLFKENPNSFVGLKFHPLIQNLELTSGKYEPYIKFADKHKLPCLFHSKVNLTDGGKLNPNNINLSDPQNIYDLAKKYPKTPVIMAHLGAGYNQSHDKAIDVIIASIKNGDANLYADISWVDIDAEAKNGHNQKDHIIKAIKRLKGIGEKDWTFGDQSYRLMFGTDAPLARFKENIPQSSIDNYTKFVDDIKFAIRQDKDLKPEAEKIIDNLFYNNAKKLYLSSKKKDFFSKKLAAIVAAAGIIITASALYLHKKTADNSKKN